MKTANSSRAIFLRKKGYSLAEISNELKISKSTCSVWLRDVEISDSGLKRLIGISELGREKSVAVNRKRRRDIFDNIDDGCTVLKNKSKYSGNDLKIFLSLLYWGEGSKTDRKVVFVNSDPEMIKSFLHLLRKSFIINDDKIKCVLHLHSYHNEQAEINFWSKVTNVKKENFSIYNKNNSGKRKKEDYHGCVSVRYGDSKIFDEISIIINRFKQFAGVV